jgi:outer membrane beta-barrel protein
MRLALTIAFLASSAQAAPPAAPAAAADRAERISVDVIKEKYWAKGEESELQIVQNRKYSKKEKFELGVYGGIIATDPFLSVKNVGGSLGFHFTESFGLNVLYWKAVVNPSSALTQFEAQSGNTTNTNKPEGFYGGELLWSPIYGKLSLVGKAILYFDMRFMLGAGMTKTESGSYMMPFLGLGQQIYLGKTAALKLDVRAGRYNEAIIEKVVVSQQGQVVGERANWSTVTTVGLGFFIN